MRFEGIKSGINNLISERYNVDEDCETNAKLMSLSDEELRHKEVIRMKRKDRDVGSWKTVALVEIEGSLDKDIKYELKMAIRWLANIKENLLGAENTDLYLFLSLPEEVGNDEGTRIESTEQFCRKYVIRPDEEISAFLNRTFLQNPYNVEQDNGVKDPIEAALEETSKEYSWLTIEMRKRWRQAFSSLNGNELSDALIGLEELE